MPIVIQLLATPYITAIRRSVRGWFSASGMEVKCEARSLRLHASVRLSEIEYGTRRRSWWERDGRDLTYADEERER